MSVNRNVPTLLAVGHVTLDRYGERLLPGGCVTYASLTFAALGGRCRVVSLAGENFPHGFFPSRVETAIGKSPCTTIFRNRYEDSGRRIQTVDDVAGTLSTAALPEKWKNADVLFLAPVLGETDAAQWIAAASSRRVAVGLQGFLRRLEGNRVIGAFFDARSAWLKGVDIAFLSDDDCLGQPGLPEQLCRRLPLVVLTHQRRGCTVFASGKTFSVGIHPAEEIDPTGAGDTFAAGFLYSLCRGGDVEEAARLGAACASIIIEGQATETIGRLSREAPLRAQKVR